MAKTSRGCPATPTEPTAADFSAVLICAEARVAARVRRALELAGRFGQATRERRPGGDGESAPVAVSADPAVVAQYYDWLADEEERVLDELSPDDDDEDEDT